MADAFQGLRAAAQAAASGGFTLRVVMEPPESWEAFASGALPRYEEFERAQRIAHERIVSAFGIPKLALMGIPGPEGEDDESRD